MVRARGAIGWWDMIRFTRVTVGYLQAIVHQPSTHDVKDQVWWIIPGMVDLGVKLNLNNLTTLWIMVKSWFPSYAKTGELYLVVNMGAYDKTLLSTLGTMADSDNVTGNNLFVFINHSYRRGCVNALVSRRMEMWTSEGTTKKGNEEKSSQSWWEEEKDGENRAENAEPL